MAQVVDEVGEDAKILFKSFLNEFSSAEYNNVGENTPASSDKVMVKDYIEQAEEMKRHELTTIFVDFKHVSSFNDQLAQQIEQDFYHIDPFLRDAVYEFVKQHQPDHTEVKSQEQQFFVSFKNHPNIVKIRDLKTEKIGQLVTFEGTVTRSSQVRPELLIGQFRCLDCETIVKNIRQQFKFTEPTLCSNPTCDNRRSWLLEPKYSTFVDWQKVRVQENSDAIPPGSMPRAMKVIFRNEIVERAKPGDKCLFTGTMVVVPDISQFSRNPVYSRRPGQPRTSERISSGIKGLTGLGARDMSYSLAFVACGVTSSYQQLRHANHREDEEETPVQDEFKEADREIIMRIKNDPRRYSKMVKSIAPNIFGHTDVKRGILLMLFGGVHKDTGKGHNLRGDINVCIVGDPSTSKSQFLKFVHGFLPRAVYTSGKASSAAGLTASLAKDEDTGEFGIEAGALMLADNGICCIDEFDKMDPTHQVAIHEAMEQQTISIAKAGIQATLNARTSVLAAANPISGRYDSSKTLKQNVDIPPPIMSRFDLFFVVLDQCDNLTDMNIAKHIITMHRAKTLGTEVPTAERAPYSIDDLRTYIRFARTTSPQLSKEARKALAQHYVRLRSHDAVGSVSKTSYRMTVRQLESMIRLGEARARLDLEQFVLKKHVDEAARLLDMSVVRVKNPDIQFDDGEFDGDAGGAGGTGEDTSSKKTTPDPGSKDDQDSEGEDESELSLSFAEYQRVSTFIVTKMRSQETSFPKGHSIKTIINWYLTDLEEHSEMEMSIPQLKNKTRLIKAIIERLVNLDNILLIVGNHGHKTNELLKVHPNYNPEEEISKMEDYTSQPSGTDTEEEKEPEVAPGPLDLKESRLEIEEILSRAPVGDTLKSLAPEDETPAETGSEEKGGSLHYEFSGSEVSESQSSTRSQKSQKRERSPGEAKSQRRSKREKTGGGGVINTRKSPRLKK